MKLILELSEQGGLKFEAMEPGSVEDVTKLLQTAQYHIMKTTIDKAPRSAREKLTQMFFDMYNDYASIGLNTLIPDNMHSDDLTAEAIMKAENEIIRTKASNIIPTRDYT